MKRMTKLTALVLSLLMLAASLVGMVACDKGEDTTTTTPAPQPPPATPTYTVITIAQAIELCGEEGNITEERYYIRGTIDTVTNAQYGAMIISDETGSISVYGTYSADGVKTYTELDYQPVKGDEVLLHCILQNYQGKPEIKNARLIEYVNNQGNVDISDYTEASIAEAREAEKGSHLLVDGVVARITYATGMKPSGFILVDEGASIYVYDGDAAQRVSIGNKVSLGGTKDFWILDSEQENAQKFGYGGCNQLTDVKLVSNDNKTDNSFDTSWITETTVKALLNTPVTEDVTTTVFKVNALVDKVEEKGYTNYYFYDLDGATGSYTYTQCNGSDFAWLDEFDGKICTVYLTPLNAKSTSTGCVFRFLPVAVYDESYVFDTAKAAEFVMEYHVDGLIKTLYTGNPNLPLPTSVSSTLLGFEGVTVSYTSDNTASVFFTETEDGLILECGEAGKATVTITASYDGVQVVETVSVVVIDPADLVADNVQTVIGKTVGESVTVRGIIGPSLINKDGFYLIDDTGIIAVVVGDKSILKDLTIGYEVVLEGTRDKFHDGKGGTHHGQTCITGASIKVNLYGNNDYCTDNFITDKTLTDVYNLDVTEDHSTEVYVVTGTVVLEGSAYYTNVKLSDGTNRLTLYSSNGATQYAFLLPFEGQTVTVEIAPCNWNNKSYYAGCVLAVYDADGNKILNEYCFNS